MPFPVQGGGRVLTEYLSLADARQSLYRLSLQENEPASA